MSIRIAFFDSKPYDIAFFNEENKNYGLDIKYYEAKLTPDTALLATGFDAVCAFVNDDLSRKTIEILREQGIRLVVLRCAGFNNVDTEAAKGKLKVLRVPAYSPHAVAEYALAMILTLNRKTHKAYQRTRENNFRIHGLLGFDLYGKTIGVIGTGKIGMTFIEILSGFGMRVLAYDAFPDAEAQKKYGFTYVDPDTLYQESDIISLHCPLNDQTYHMINEESLSKMKDGVMLINTSRGALIDSKALIVALKSRKIGSAALDVYEEEENFFFEDISDEVMPDDILARLLSFNNVLITSHQGFFTREAEQNIAAVTLKNVALYFDGGDTSATEVRT
ncbi:MAG: 2-hydroxyacid dehydrogenase [Spirochaetia bacterium]|nr:2-hydroxyacid dehydrogenase [Spirochaetia bacterium]